MGTISGREISVKPLNEAQVMLIMREGQLLKSDKVEVDRRMKGVSTILNIVEASIEDPEDREWVIDQVAMGIVEFPELLRLVAPQVETDTPPKPVRRATRKR